MFVRIILKLLLQIACLTVGSGMIMSIRSGLDSATEVRSQSIQPQQKVFHLISNMKAHLQGAEVSQ